jgi:multicomponent Na+:H+ antiporter subunit E
MSRLVFGTLNLALVYTLVLISAHPLDILAGALVGLALTATLTGRLALAPRGGEAGVFGRVLWFPAFAGAVVVDVLAGTWDVALRVLHLRGLRGSGIVRVPFGDRTAQGVAVSALATTLSPGSVLVDLDHDRREMLVHVIDATDPDGVRERMQRFYDRYQRRVFP